VVIKPCTKRNDNEYITSPCYSESLPIILALSLIVAVLMTVLSLAGLRFKSNLYSTEALRRAFVSNDLVNLSVGLPILLGSMRFGRWDSPPYSGIFWLQAALRPAPKYWVANKFQGYSRI